MRALSIRQPYAEKILLGYKTIEYRTRRTSVIGERFYIYAAMGRPTAADMKGYVKIAWTPAKLDALPRGAIVGTVVIAKATGPTKRKPYYHWHLAGAQRLARPRKPKNHPQPAWFTPF